MSDVTITMSREDALNLSTLLTVLAGTIQGKVLDWPADKVSLLDKLFNQWLPISKAVAEAAGFEAFSEPHRINHIKIEIEP